MKSGQAPDGLSCGVALAARASSAADEALAFAGSRVAIEGGDADQGGGLITVHGADPPDAGEEAHLQGLVEHDLEAGFRQGCDRSALVAARGLEADAATS